MAGGTHHPFIIMELGIVFLTTLQFAHKLQCRLCVKRYFNNDLDVHQGDGTASMAKR